MNKEKKIEEFQHVPNIIQANSVMNENQGIYIYIYIKNY